MLPQHPQTLADIVGLSIRVVRVNTRLIVRTLLWPSILSCACVSASRLVVAHWFRVPPESFLGLSLHSGALFLLFSIFSIAQWQMMIRGVAIMRFCLGYAISYKDALSYIDERRSLLGKIYSAAAFLPLVLFSIFLPPAFFIFEFHRFFSILMPFRIAIVILFFLSSSFANLWSFLVGSMWLSVIACEDLSLKQILKRGLHLSNVAIFRGILFICFIVFTVSILSLGLNVPLIAVTLIDQTFSALPKTANLITVELPTYFEILIACWGGILNMLLLAVALVADGLYYQDLRIRFEGVDIKERLAQLV